MTTLQIARTETEPRFTDGELTSVRHAAETIADAIERTAAERQPLPAFIEFGGALFEGGALGPSDSGNVSAAWFEHSDNELAVIEIEFEMHGGALVPCNVLFDNGVVGVRAPVHALCGF